MPSITYVPVNWEDAPSTNTPISSDNLNTMDTGIASLYNDVAAIEEELSEISFADATNNTVTFETSQQDLQPSGSTLSRIMTGVYSKITSLLDVIPLLTPKADFSDLLSDVAFVEETNIASRNYSAGDYIVYQNKFLKANTTINENEDFTSNVYETTIGAEIQSAASGSSGHMQSYVGMIIHSTILSNMEDVISLYGGTTWIPHTEYFLRGATSGVTFNSASSDDGHDSLKLTANQCALPSHTHNHSHTHGTGDSSHTYFPTASGGLSTGVGVASTGYPYKVVYVNSSNSWSSRTQTGNPSASATSATSIATASQAFDNRPLFKKVYIWERTA